MKKKLFVLDGHALCYRAYYAFIRNPLFNSDGQNVSAIFGFTRMLLKLLEEQKPDYLVVAFDPPQKTFRADLYPEYKANRQKMPDDLRTQIDGIQQLVDAMGFTRLEQDNYEADDLMGSIAQQYASSDVDVVLVTGDKDAYQLVNEFVSIYANKKGISDYEIYDRQAVIDKLGISPEQVIDYMALVGDSADNVPGVKGIGPKSAEKLISEYHSLDQIYENVDNIKGRSQKLLIADKEKAYLSQELVKIKTDLSVNLDFSQIALPDYKTSAVKDLLAKLEMNSLIADIFGHDVGFSDHSQAERGIYTCIKSIVELKAVLAQLQEAKLFAVDTETTSVKAVDAEIIGMSFALKAGEAWYLPLTSGGLFNENTIDRQEALALVKPILEDQSLAKIGQNIKYDILVLQNENIFLRGVCFDTMIASYILNPGERRHNMDDLAADLLNYKTITYKELVGTGQKAIPLEDVPLDKLTEYAAEDADVTFRLYEVLKKRIDESNLKELYYNLELPLMKVLVEMEKNGVSLDKNYFAKLSQKSAEQLVILEKEIYQLAGETFNINSTKELSRILFEKIGLKPVKKTKTGFSTDITVLEALKNEHDIVKAIISYRSLAKLKGTYIDTLPNLISAKTGRLHTSFNQTVAATGRLSSSDPNMQNIPSRDQFGFSLRHGFVAQKDWKILSADYSQIELRLAAHYSHDKNMQEAFNEGIDIHSLTASKIFAVKQEDVTAEMRKNAKTVNFATIYGVSPFGLSQQAEISVSEASEFIKKYFATYPGFKDYMEQTITFAQEKGYVETLLGRRRELRDINAKSSFVRKAAERVAVNTPIQGTAADLIKKAMLVIQEKIEKNKMRSKMILQVHDELVFEVPEEEIENLKNIVKTEMEKALELEVPILVEIGLADSWGAAH